MHNNGLAHPIEVLAPVVAQFANATAGVTRADIWVLAAAVGADVANHGQTNQPVDFTMNWFATPFAVMPKACQHRVRLRLVLLGTCHLRVLAVLRCFNTLRLSLASISAKS